MANFFKKHPDVVLITATVVFLAVLIGYFFWGITTLVATFNAAINPGKTEGAALRFDLQGAAKLNLKGLVQQQ